MGAGQARIVDRRLDSKCNVGGRPVWGQVKQGL